MTGGRDLNILAGDEHREPTSVVSSRCLVGSVVSAVTTNYLRALRLPFRYARFGHER